jgi:hypothetical protein
MTLNELFERFNTCGRIGLSRAYIFESFGPELKFYDEGDVCEFDIIHNGGLLDAEVMGVNPTLDDDGEPMLEIGLVWDMHKSLPTNA